MTCTCGVNEACSNCPPTVNMLHEHQRRVVNELQKRIQADAHRIPTGQLKDLALALAAAVDKLNALNQPVRMHWGYNQLRNTGTGNAP